MGSGRVGVWPGGRGRISPPPSIYPAPLVGRAASPFDVTIAGVTKRTLDP